MRGSKWLVPALAGLCLCAGASAQQYPRKPVTLVVPFPPGAATDAFARVIAKRMSEILG